MTPSPPLPSPACLWEPRLGWPARVGAAAAPIWRTPPGGCRSEAEPARGQGGRSARRSRARLASAGSSTPPPYLSTAAVSRLRGLWSSPRGSVVAFPPSRATGAVAQTTAGGLSPSQYPCSEQEPSRAVATWRKLRRDQAPAVYGSGGERQHALKTGRYTTDQVSSDPAARLYTGEHLHVRNWHKRAFRC